MKLKLVAACGTLLLAGLSFVACNKEKDTITEDYSFYRVSTTSLKAVRESIAGGAPLKVTSPGKLVVRDNYVYLVEKEKGVHVIDYRNPERPANVAFINIPGNVDIAVRGSYLYADCYNSLAVIDISVPTAAQLVRSVSDVFRNFYIQIYKGDSIIQSWKRVDTTVTYQKSLGFDKSLGHTVSVIGDIWGDFFYTANSAAAPSNGTGGSQARFALYNDRMYTVDYSSLSVFNTANPANPSFVKNIPVGSFIETIFPYQQKMFMGSQAGMFIYDVSNKDNPSYISGYSHIRSCDPVVTDGKYAYVTLHGGTACGGFSNQLDVLDITDIMQPVLVKTYPMKKPKGLWKDGDLLFVCDDTDGLKIYNASNPQDHKLLKQVKRFTSYDVIAQNKVALVSAEDGLYFVNYSSPAAARVVGQLSFKK